MDLLKNLTDVFIKYNYGLEDISFFIEDTIESIEKEKINASEDIFKEFTIDLIKGKNSLFLKSVHIFIISYVEAFNREFFSILRKNKEEFYRQVAGSIPRTNPTSIENYLQNSLELEIRKEFPQWDDFCENLVRRNKIVHNRSRIDKEYIDLVENNIILKPEMEFGKEIPHDLNYITGLITNCFHYFAYTFIKIMKYYFNYNEVRGYVRKTLRQYADVDPNFLDFYPY